MDCDNGYTPISGETGQSFTATINGNYAVIVTQNACTDTSSCYSVTSLRVIENYSDFDILIYPNPTTGTITIEGINIEMIEVINIEGQIIQKTEVENDKTNIVLSLQSKGIYFVKVITNTGIKTEKIVVE